MLHPKLTHNKSAYNTKQKVASLNAKNIDNHNFDGVSFYNNKRLFYNTNYATFFTDTNINSKKINVKP